MSHTNLYLLFYLSDYGIQLSMNGFSFFHSNRITPLFLFSSKGLFQRLFFFTHLKSEIDFLSQGFHHQDINHRIGREALFSNSRGFIQGAKMNQDCYRCGFLMLFVPLILLFFVFQLFLAKRGQAVCVVCFSPFLFLQFFLRVCVGGGSLLLYAVPFFSLVFSVVGFILRFFFIEKNKISTTLRWVWAVPLW